MKTSLHLPGVVAIISTCLTLPVWSQNAPGEDPVVLTKRVTVQMSPTGGSRTSSPMESITDMPAWMKAKVARYEAKANSDMTRGISTDTDATTQAASDGFKKTCIQEVGSTTTTSMLAGSRLNTPGNSQQIVVLKGDLVNICK